MRILVSGSREYSDYESVLDAIEEVAGTNIAVCVVQGGARGADALGKRAAEELGISVDEFPADWSIDNAGSIRNGQMIASGIDFALFFLSSKARNIGTRDAMKRAKSAGIPSKYYLDGAPRSDMQIRYMLSLN